MIVEGGRMRFSVEKVEIQGKLANLQNVIEKRNTMPILSHCLINAEKNNSYIVATDMQIALKESLDMNVEDGGSICLPARKLYEIIRELEGETIAFEQEEDSWVKIISKTSNFRLVTLPSSDFPVWPDLGEIEKLTILSSLLLEMIDKTIYAAGEGDTRYTLNGLLFHMKPVSKSMNIVGTDGHRLALITKNIDINMEKEKKLIVPRKAVSEIRRFLTNLEERTISLLIGEKHLLFELNGIQFLTRLVEGTYPNYENVIPTNNERKMYIDREAFSRLLRRVSTVSKERANAVKMDINGDKLIVTSSNPELGDAYEELSVVFEGEGLVLGFNARYILDVLEAMNSEKVVCEIKDSLSPVLFKEETSEDYKCVVMPLRI